MLGKLTEIQINNLLTRQAVGRIGYHDAKKTYITPVTYAFDGVYVYGQSNEGLKLEIMRKDPYVCFEVDAMMSMSNWESVIAWGHFEELFGEEAVTARAYLYNKILDLLTASAVHPHEHGAFHTIDDSNRIKEVMYRIKLVEKTGRFEKR
jgi:nitroimidazol reductase NimA-like FMN-containing flavoprotein (pyridoxamine 5'-phosphate oxidase superfamily)